MYVKMCLECKFNIKQLPTNTTHMYHVTVVRRQVILPAHLVTIHLQNKHCHNYDQLSQSHTPNGNKPYINLAVIYFCLEHKILSFKDKPNLSRKILPLANLPFI